MKSRAAILSLFGGCLVACGGAASSPAKGAPVLVAPIVVAPPAKKAVGLVPPAVTAPDPSPWSSHVPIDDILDSRAGMAIGARFPRRATLASARSMRFTADGPRFARDAAGDVIGDAFVVEEHDAMLRVVVGNDAVRLVVLVDQADAVAVTNERVVLTTSASGVAGDASVGLAAGVPVHVVETSGDDVRVRGTVDDVSFVGWLPRDQIGATFLPGSSPKPGPVDGELDWGAAVASASGVVVAQFANVPSFVSGKGVDVRLVGAPLGDKQKIAFSTDRIEVRGLVDASLVRPRPPSLIRQESGTSQGSLGFESDTTPVTIARGARLYTSDGFRVGVALRPVEAFAGSVGTVGSIDLEPVDVDVDGLGFVTIFVRAADVSPRSR